jgi:hypothetical protein
MSISWHVGTKNFTEINNYVPKIQSEQSLRLNSDCGLQCIDTMFWQGDYKVLELHASPILGSEYSEIVVIHSTPLLLQVVGSKSPVKNVATCE